ncbi:dynein regulation protein LC7 [Actinomadura cremea]|nr:dynein regulation protein LC7 [Actinomadura cremea]
MTPDATGEPTLTSPKDFAWLVNDFVDSTPGVTDALIVSCDGLVLIASRALPGDQADTLSAMAAGLLSLGGNIADNADRGTCEHIMLRLTHGHFLFMRIGQFAGLAVLTDTGAALGPVAHRMTRLVTGTGHALTPQLRDDLHRHTIHRAHA